MFMLRITGLTGKPWFDILTPSDEHASQTGARNVLKNKTSKFSYEMREMGCEIYKYT